VTGRSHPRATPEFEYSDEGSAAEADEVERMTMSSPQEGRLNLTVKKLERAKLGRGAWRSRLV
jgi:hypothetical protein